MTLEYKVPRILWENLESVLLAQSKKYIGEIAKRLGVPEKELQKRILPSSDSLYVMIQDSQAETNQCKAYVQHGKITCFCRKSVAYHSGYCAVHRQQRMTVIPGEPPILLQKMKERNTMEPLWIKQHLLINANDHVIGVIHHDERRIKLFVLPA